MNIGEKIRQARGNKFTQIELAKKIGIAQVSLNRYENNKRTPTPQMLKKIADVLGKDINYFYYDPPRKDTIKDKEKSEIYDLVMSISNSDKQFILGFLRMFKEGIKNNKTKSFEDVWNELTRTIQLTKENEILIRKLLMMIKVTGQEKLEAVMKILGL